MDTKKKNPHAVALGALGGKKGIKNKLKAHPEWMAQKAARVRWDAVRKAAKQ